MATPGSIGTLEWQHMVLLSGLSGNTWCSKYVRVATPGVIERLEW